MGSVSWAADTPFRSSKLGRMIWKAAPDELSTRLTRPPCRSTTHATLIGDHHFDRGVPRGQRHAHRRIRRAVLQRVVDQVERGETKQMRVASDDQAWLDSLLHVDPTLDRHGGERVHRLSEKI